MGSFAFRAILAATVLGCSVSTSRVALAGVPSYATTDETIRGTIVALTGKYALTLQDERGFMDSVTLHDGTVIGPTGVTLQTDEAVTIVGHAAGSTFVADEIDVDGTDAGSSYGDAAGGNYYLGPYAADTYPPYVITYGGGVYGYFPGGYYPGGFSPCCFGPGIIIVTPPQNRSAHSVVTPVLAHPLPIGHQPILRPRGPVLAPARQAAPSGGHSGGSSGKR